MEILDLSYWVIIMRQTQGNIYRVHRVYFFLFLLLGEGGVYDTSFFVVFFLRNQIMFGIV